MVEGRREFYGLRSIFGEERQPVVVLPCIFALVVFCAVLGKIAPFIDAQSFGNSDIVVHGRRATGTPSASSAITTAQNEQPIFGTPDVLLPRNMYAMVGAPGPTVTEEFNIYDENLIVGYYNPQWWRGTDLRWSATPNYGIQGTGRWWIEPGNTSGNANSNAFFGDTSGTIALSVTIKDAAGNQVASGTTTVNLESKSNTADPIRLAVIGDSQSTDGGNGYITQAARELPGSNVTTEGIVNFGRGDISDEGRPGWTFNGTASNGYMTTFCSVTGVDSPFLFPNGVSATNYRGNTSMWKSIVNGTSTFGGFTLAAKEGGSTFQYSATNGYPLSPVTGWVVCDPTQPAGARYMQYNGTSWVAMTTQPSGVMFSYADYLARYAWAFTAGAPTHVAIMLGTNDFFGVTLTGSALTAYLTSYAKMIASIHAADPTAKIIIQLPPAGSSQDGFGWVYGTTPTTYLNFRHNMQLLARQLLNTYDTAAENAAGVYVVSHLTDIDPVYGWMTQAIQPNKFSTNATIMTDNNSVHPHGGVGYQQMGDSLAAIVQALR